MREYLIWDRALFFGFHADAHRPELTSPYGARFFGWTKIGGNVALLW